MTETTLFNNAGSTNPASIALSDDVRNYDEIVLVALVARDGGYITCEYYPSSVLTAGVNLACCSDTTYVTYTLTDWTTLTYVSNIDFVIKKILGITR